MQTSDLVELAISLAFETWLLVLLFRRGVRRHFPIFLVYVICALVSTCVRLLAFRHYRSYFYTYWCTEAVLLPLSLAALHEVFHWMFAGFYRVWWFRLLYYGTIAAVLAVAVRNALVSPPIQAHPVIGMILNISIAVNFVRMGIVSLFIVLQKLLITELRRYAYGIVIGFGFSSAGSLLGYLARSEFGTKVETFTRYASAVGYILGVIIWVASFMRPEPEDKWQPPMSPERMLEEVQSYMGALGFSRRRQ